MGEGSKDFSDNPVLRKYQDEFERQTRERRKAEAAKKHPKRHHMPRASDDITVRENQGDGRNQKPPMTDLDADIKAGQELMQFANSSFVHGHLVVPDSNPTTRESDEETETPQQQRAKKQEETTARIKEKVGERALLPNRVSRMLEDEITREQLDILASQVQNEPGILREYGVTNQGMVFALKEAEQAEQVDTRDITVFAYNAALPSDELVGQKTRFAIPKRFITRDSNAAYIQFPGIVVFDAFTKLAHMSDDEIREKYPKDKDLVEAVRLYQKIGSFKITKADMGNNDPLYKTGLNLRRNVSGNASLPTLEKGK